ncbi:hypothetical protein B0H63DRAFT_544433 [Podospora didyma]|uniref:Uncharacterized protein n=1 Tax=Podospora didyma TaxID=330526 RepID=A0AAE0U032_9PEZI|nr:hypothetical protein B0H63DRAFT_544433 [Podospora didyma]
MDHVPGEYPVTPFDDDMTTHREHNKLHKPQDPRGQTQQTGAHNYTDSGVGLTEQQHAAQFSNLPVQEPKRSELSEAVGGGTYSREEAFVPEAQKAQPQGVFGSEAKRDTFDSQPLRSNPSETPVGALFSRHHDTTALESQPKKVKDQDAFGLEPTTHSAKGAYTAPSHSRNLQEAADRDTFAPRDSSVEQPRVPGENTGPTTQGGSVTPPYWGKLPKAAGGGIYNTVTGHGSPKDDHAQHQKSPSRSSASERSHISGPTSDYPGNGIHNTVTGHGSQDDDSRRHAAGHSSVDRSAATGGLLAATMPPIENQRSSATHTGRSDPSLSSPTSARGDAMPAHSSAGVVGGKEDPTTFGTSSYEPTPRTSSHSPRAFPLSTDHHDDAAAPNHRTRDGLLAGGAGVGAGVAASELADKYRGHSKDQDVSPVREDRHASKHDTTEKKHHAIAGVLPHREKEHKEEKHPAPVESKPTREATVLKKKSREDSPPQEKKHHGIMGIFHRHKDDKKTEETTTTEPTKHHTSDHSKHEKDSKHEKEKIAAGTAAGAGAMGLMHKHKEDNLKERSQETAPERTRISPEYGSGSHATGPTSVVAAPMAQHATHQSSNPTEYESSRQGQPPSPTHAAQSSNRDQSSDASHQRPLAAAGAGVAAGLGASHYAHSKEQSSHPHVDSSTGYSQAQSTGISAPQQSTHQQSSVPFAATGTASNMFSSGHKSGTPSSSSLAQGTTPSRSTDATSTGHRSNKPQGSEPYNVLPSGTPSGVKVEPRGSRTLQDYGPTSQDDSQHSRNQHGGLAAATGAGVAAGLGASQLAHHQNQGSNNSPTQVSQEQFGRHQSEPYNNRPASNEPLLDTSHAGRRNDVVIHSRQQDSRQQFRAPETQMSPEVMPSAYTESAPRSTALPGTHSKDNAPPVPSKDYPTGARDFSGDYQNAQPERQAEQSQGHSQGHSQGPALAAATGAWTSTAGTASGNTNTGSGASGAGKVLHKCQHCGGDNDISQYFTKEGVKAMKNGTGFW